MGRGDLTLLGKVPRCPKSLTTWDDGDLDKGVGVLEEPADRRMTCFVQGDAVALLFGRHLVFLLQPTHDSVNGVHEVLSRDEVLTCTSSYEGSLVTDICNVCSGKAWGAPCK